MGNGVKSRSHREEIRGFSIRGDALEGDGIQVLHDLQGGTAPLQRDLERLILIHVKGAALGERAAEERVVERAGVLRAEMEVVAGRGTVLVVQRQPHLGFGARLEQKFRPGGQIMRQLADLAAIVKVVAKAVTLVFVPHREIGG